MHIKPWLLTLACLVACALESADAAKNDPRIGYLSPAGGCRNTSFEIIAGGQGLRSMKDVRVSGSGVQARIIKVYRQPKNLDGDQRELLKWRVACRRAEINGRPMPPEPKPKAGPDGKPTMVEALPELPLLDMLGSMDLTEIEHWVTVYKRYDRKQPNPQLAEIVRIEIKIAADAEPGMRELRLGGPLGLSNPIRFEVGTLPEVFESEPNEPDVKTKSVVSDLPCTFNGQIQSGDVDVFRFHARRGQNLVVKGEARALIPYLADAVPGWFQMVVLLRDSNGSEVAYSDDFRFDPDPVLCFKVPDDGDYELQVRDSIYRGREDFIYRISVGELPFVTSVFPLGGREGVALAASVSGWNLSGGKIKLDTTPGLASTRVARYPARIAPSNEVSYAVDSLPEVGETEPNEDSDHATDVPFPCVVNGRIGKPGDADVFRIDGKQGQEIVIEVLARRLKSPLDSVVHVADERCTVLGWNDDSMEKDGTLHLGDGLLTHYADSRVRVKLPEDGPIFVRIADTQLHGGPDHAYRLRIHEAQPDFELRVTPSALNLSAGEHAPFQVHVLRNDGFEGEITLSLKDAPPGFHLSGARIPAGATQARLTLSTPASCKPEAISLMLNGTAVEKGISVTRTAIAADNVMQAFLWRHFVTADEWLVNVIPGRGKRPPIEIVNPLPLTVAAGGKTEVSVKLSKWIVDKGIELELSDAPQGISLSAARPMPNGFAFDVMADASVAPRLECNLIIDLISKAQLGGKQSKAQTRRPLTSLPAIPITLLSPTAP